MILVTGGTGLVGAHILYQLCRTETEVIAIKRASSDLHFVESLFEFYAGGEATKLLNKVQWREADITDIDDMLEVTKEVEIVYHAAAVVSFNPRDRQKMIESNIEGTANLVNACQNNGVQKIGYISSVAALGPSKTSAPLDEDCHWEISTENSAYAISKYGAEREVWRISEEGVQVVMVNPSIILGPGNWNNSSTSIFKTVYNGLKYYTEGTTGFVDVRDVSEIMIKLVNSDIHSERFVVSAENLIWRDVFTNIANQLRVKPPSVKVRKFKAELAWRLMKVISWFTGNPPKVTKDAARSSLRNRRFSSKKCIETLGVEFRSIDQSIADTVEFLKRYYIK